MKIVILAAVAGLGLATGTAFAGEGAGNPFAYQAPGLVTVFKGRAVLPGGSTDPYPFRGNGTPMTAAMSEQMMPANGAEGAVQTANSLPPGFENGTAAFGRQESVQNYRAAAAARVAQHKTGTMPPKG